MTEFNAEIEQWLSTLGADDVGIFFNLPGDSTVPLGLRTTGIKRKHSDKRAEKPPTLPRVAGSPYFPMRPLAFSVGWNFYSRSGSGSTGQRCCWLPWPSSCIPWCVGWNCSACLWGEEQGVSLLWNHLFKPWPSGFKQKCMLHSEGYCV